MRLLQLATGPGELIDLHPNVTVVTGLHPSGRELLVAAVTALAAGHATGPRGLLEAHGVLFDLAPEALALLDIAADGVLPVVVADDLPVARPATPSPPPPSELEERWRAAQQGDRVAKAAVLASAEAVTRARDTVPVPAPDAGVTALDAAVERRDALVIRLADLVRELDEARAARAAIEASTMGERERADAAAAVRAAAAARLAAAREARDPDAVLALEDATVALEALEVEVEASRQAVQEPPPDGEPPAERLARIEAEVEATETRLAAFGPADVEQVRTRLEPLRSIDGPAVAPLAEAQALADELEALEAELVATEAQGGTPGGGLPEGRVRLDEARQALLEAEHAVRRPELDRDTVERLEVAHADLLAALEKAEGRLFGARAQRRVDAMREAESAILAELDLPSYSDYMMGSSLLHVDPVKEAALDAARAELSAAEDAWRDLSAEAETELVRAERMEHRRGRIEDARRLLGRPVPTGALVGELRALRVAAEPPAAELDALRRALDDAGVAVGDERLDREDLVLLAEAWLVEAEEAVAREAALRDDLVGLQDERSAARAEVEAAEGRWAAPPPIPSEPSDDRLADARERRAAAEERHLAHLAVEREVATLAEELAETEAAERVARDGAAEADVAIAAATEAEASAAATHDRVAAELAGAEQAVVVAREEGERSQSQGEVVSPLVIEAEATHARSVARAAEAAILLAAVEEERAAAPAAASEPAPDAVAPTASSEEVEWYLLARLAAQRSLSLGGSLPMLLDDALTGLPDADLEHVLGRLERMADAVQVIVVSDDPVVAAWAGRAGADRAALVRPEASSTV